MAWECKWIRGGGGPLLLKEGFGLFCMCGKQRVTHSCKCALIVTIDVDINEFHIIY